MSRAGDEVYRSIDDPVTLRRILSATLLLESNLDLPTLLRHLVEEARSMTGARYAALGVLNAEGTGLSEFVTSGMTPEEERAVGGRPTGKGVLGVLIDDPRPLRLADLGAHPDGAGFPPGHPPMRSFLGVPVKVRDRVYGNLYLTDKQGWSEFTADDEVLVVALSVAAGFAVENARLHRRAQEAAVLEDRERLARDLHDTVIQRLFAVGLSLQGISNDPAATAVAERLAAAVADIDETIRQVRTSIFELGAAGAGRGIRAHVLSLVRELEPVVGCPVEVAFVGPVDVSVPDTVAEHLLATVREALTNVGRHAGATRATATLSVADGRCRLDVTDDGRGLPADGGTGTGLGLANLHGRAASLGGTCTVRGPAGGGTTVTWDVPLPD